MNQNINIQYFYNNAESIDLTKIFVEGYVGVKWVAIVYVSILQVIIGIIISKTINKMVPPIRRKKDKKTPIEPMRELLFYSFVNLSLLVLANYMIRNIMESIPYPFDGLYGYKHDRLKERYGMVISGFILMYYQDNLRERLTIIFKEIFD